MANVPPKKTQFVVRVVLSFGLLAILAYSINLQDLAGLLLGVRPEFVLLVLAAQLVDRLINTWRWQVMLRAQGVVLPLWPLFRIQMTTGCLGSFLPSNVGVDVLRMMAISKCTDRSIQAVAASALDRGLNVGITLIVAAIAGIFAAGRYLPWSVALAMIVLCFAFFIIGLVFTRPTLSRMLGPLIKRTLGVGLSEKLKTIYQSFLEYGRQPRILALASALTLLILLVRVMIVYLEALALNIHIDFLALALVMPLAWILLMLPISVGGIGLQEGAFFAALRGLGVSGAGAVSISILEHLLSRIVILPGFYFYLRGGLVGARKDEIVRCASTVSQQDRPL
ncbi:lysylphosphatidylglycerol synthase transmembrane domain-containing protein [Desulfonatronum sp. SC1]|uniref:lysylphosphatidylglycerol synthase transmembrane domain-containing protein n=1 Tax=Desulfonatronum sp. SC1 TaxID=2109626 RepID=UPI0013049BDA|nr:lysylphosphatidylglycerol synthase transmembrane domain-containing protein [Desulfonatronum sp. SC1]